MGQDCSRMAVRLILFAFFSWPLGWKWLLTTPAASGTWQYVGRQQQYLVTQSSSRRPTHSLLPFTQAEWKHQHSQTMTLAKNSNAYSTEQIWLKTVYDLIICVGRAAAPAPLMICANGRGWDPVWRPHHLHLEGFYLAREEWGQEMLTWGSSWASGSPWNSMQTSCVYGWGALIVVRFSKGTLTPKD